MVFCIIGLAIFGILGIFSAKYRAYFKEALHCTFQTATLRPCTTGFDKKMQMKISTKLAKINKGLGNFVFKYFQAISVLFIAIMIVSLALAGIGFYNWIAFGNCNGPQGGNCVLNDLTGRTDLETCDQNSIINDLNQPTISGIQISSGG